MRLSTLTTCLLALVILTPAALAEVLYTYRGDGLELQITQESADGSFAGNLVFNGNTYPMQCSQNAEQTLAQGTFQANGQSFKFTAKPVNNGQAIQLETGGTSYTLRQVNTPSAPGPGVDNPSRENPAPANGEAMVMRKHTIKDPGMQNMESHTMLVPEGWKVEGGVLWNPLSQFYFASLGLQIAAPDGREILWIPNTGFSFYRGQGQNIQIPQQGQMTGDGSIFMPPPHSPKDLVTNLVIKQFRPNATNVQVTKVERVTHLEQAYLPLFGPLIQQAKQLDRQTKQTSAMSGDQSGYSFNYQYPAVHVTYTENGKQYEELFTYLQTQNESYYTYRMINTWFQTSTWAVCDLISFRAPLGQLETQLPKLITISNSVKPTQRWYSCIKEIEKRLAQQRQQNARKQWIANQNALKARQAAFQQTQKTIAQNSSDILDMQMDSWKKKNESQDRMSRAWSNTMHGVDDYKLPDGTTRSLDSSYKKVYTNGTGDFLFTNDLLNNPNVGSTVQWDEIKPVTPMGGAANY